jgi:hypothetical protein
MTRDELIATIAVLQSRKSDATRLIAEYRANESKPQRKLLGGLVTDLATTMLDVPANHSCAVAADHFTGLVSGADPAVLRDQFVAS